MRINFPAEWQNQEALVLNFPHAKTDWKNNLARVEEVFLHLAKIISSEQILVLLFADKDLRARVLAKFNARQLQNIKSFIVDSDDTWARDFFAISTFVDGEPRLLDFTFNGWGNKFSAEKDDAINATLARQNAFKADLQKIDLVLEGGAIETDGEGTLLTSHLKNLHLKRNQNISEEQLCDILKSTLGINRILSLETGHLVGDDTDGHIDTLARFVNKNTIVYSSCDAEDDEHFEPLQAMQKELQQFSTASGEPYNLIALPLPNAIYSEAGERLPASYVNFIILRNSVILPIYGDKKADSFALNAMRKAMPNYKIYTVDARIIIEQGGSLHCLSMQLPANFLQI